MVSRRVLALVVVLALVACVSVQARHGRSAGGKRNGPVITDLSEDFVELQSAPTASTPHPQDVADEATLANWARIRAELEANNYGMPQPEESLANNYTIGAPHAGTLGVDVSQLISQSSWSCIKGKGYSFGIVRAYRQVCSVDPNGVHSVANAWAAGMKYMDIYLFPAYGCSTSAASQVDATINNMGSVPFGKLWLDIEQGGHKDQATNHAWMMAAVNRAVARLGASRVGIYSSAYQWSVVMGNRAGPGAQYQMWYAHYDGRTTFDDFKPFGGWTRPGVKQFAGDVSMCSAGVDLNWY